MKINNKIRSYIVIIAYLIIGLMIMGTVQLIKVPNRINSSLIILLSFILVNLITCKIFKLNNEIKIFWSLRKVAYLFSGMIIGGFIAIIPVLVGLLSGKVSINEITLNTIPTLSSILLTLIVVAWEELWFRGIFLNYCNKYLSAIGISITIGVLFMMAHIFNPEINLLKSGPTLFFAGTFLTIVYFYFKTIWLPIGLHFGNNMIDFAENKIENHWLLGNEGYLGTLILAGLFLLFVKLIQNGNKIT